MTTRHGLFPYARIRLWLQECLRLITIGRGPHPGAGGRETCSAPACTAEERGHARPAKQVSYPSASVPQLSDTHAVRGIGAGQDAH